MTLKQVRSKVGVGAVVVVVVVGTVVGAVTVVGATTLEASLVVVVVSFSIRGGVLLVSRSDPSIL